LGAGARPRDALEALLAEDDGAGYRQVAVVDAAGEVAVHTGAGCIREAGHLEEDGWSVQANMMASTGVWTGMAEGFRSAEGSLARRLVAALDAGESAGGDIRGRQSAALLVVPAVGEPWRRVCDLRVEDHPEPLVELRRLLDLREAYDLAAEGDELAGKGRHPDAGERYRRAAQLAPGNEELLFWAGLALADAGDVDGGSSHVNHAIAAHPGWRELLARLDPELAPGAERVRAALGIERARGSAPQQAGE
jgi:uncharacterized Ntn-hydrolase superfamily protein